MEGKSAAHHPHGMQERDGGLADMGFHGHEAVFKLSASTLDRNWGESDSHGSLARNCARCSGIPIIRPNHFGREMLPDFIRSLYDVSDLTGSEARLERMNQSDEP